MSRTVFGVASLSPVRRFLSVCRIDGVEALLEGHWGSLHLSSGEKKKRESWVGSAEKEKMTRAEEAPLRSLSFRNSEAGNKCFSVVQHLLMHFAKNM